MENNNKEDKDFNDEIHSENKSSSEDLSETASELDETNPNTEKELKESNSDNSERLSESNDDNTSSNNDIDEISDTKKDSNFFTEYGNYLVAGTIGIILLGIFILAFLTSSDNSSVVLLEATVPSEEVEITQDNSKFTSNLLLIILSLLTLISISLSFWLYYWRKLIIADKEIMVPETFESNIQTIKKVSNKNSLNIQNALDRQTAALKSSRKRADDANDEISRISEVIAHLQNALENKDEEIERFKKGYDAEIFHKFLLRFTRVDKVLKEYIDEGEIDLDGLEDIHIQMEDALLECGVECFSPEIGKSYKSQDNIEDNPKRIPATEKSQHETVAEVTQMGYLRSCEDSSIEVISKAKVKIYEFVEEEKNYESSDNKKIKE